MDETLFGLLLVIFSGFLQGSFALLLLPLLLAILTVPQFNEILIASSGYIRMPFIIVGVLFIATSVMVSG